MPALDVLDEVKARGKVYTETMIGLVAFFGGPLAAGYLFIENYKVLGQPEKVQNAWIYSILGQIALFGGAYVLSETFQFSAIGFSIISLSISRILFKSKQAAAVTQHVEQGGEVHSPWRAASICFLFFLAIVTVVFTVTYFSVYETEPSIEEMIESPTIAPTIATDIQTRSYGEAAHVMVYDGNVMSQEGIDALANQLTTVGFFDEENQKVVYLEMSLRGIYSFSVTDIAADPSSSATQKLYKKTKAQLEGFLAGTEVELLLMNEELNEVLTRF